MDAQQRAINLAEGGYGMRERLPSINIGNGFGFQ